MKWLKYILFLFACKKYEDGFTIYKIKKGEHRCNKVSGLTESGRLSFFVKFTESCKYEIKGDNRFDINKLYGLSDNSGHHDNSVRIGWRCLNDTIQLFSYCYVSGIRYDKYLCDAKVNEEIFCSVNIQEDAYFVEAGNTWDVIKRDESYKIGYVYELLPYFGGNEVAPHDIVIKIKKCD